MGVYDLVAETMETTLALTIFNTHLKFIIVYASFLSPNHCKL
jgi:hypothetical protein